MGIFTRNGIFYLEYKQDDKLKRMSLKTKNKELAQRMYESYLVSQITHRINGVMTQKAHHENAPTLKKDNKALSFKVSLAFREYLTLCLSQKLSPEIIKSKERLMKLFIDKGIKQLDNIDQKFIGGIVKDYKRDTANRYMKNLKAFLNFCIKKRYYDRMSFESLSFIKQNENMRDTTISEKDYKKLVQTARDKDFNLYLQTLWETGCRPNEIVSLKKSDIDFDKGIGKIYQSKTKKYKTVYLTDELLEKIQTLKTEYIFEGYDRQKEYYAKKFRDLRDELGMNKEYCLYAFRHSFGTRMLNKTKDIHLVSKLLGHSDISITAKHYINRNTDEIREKLLEAHHNKD
ncbi:MAG: tyrosine-type recombinase/integrase [Brevinema sp.]